ncbi:PREDICTED: E3 ubiquitin-protein ligase MIB2 [Condylura cristata]|uniref:E3 ubiquitin-protein ligase MIB2 n=1 Tax=Condylura cristata TaxID=143302 RepID=UPI00033464AF|nr:PREDICTED: E3 ubiquitin-protein ligase MIB2 [Condylura cristata]
MDPDPQAGVQVGMRVVRGVDWKWGQQDGGEGGVGTVVELGRHGSPSTPDRTVVVQWDHGTRTNYRAGYQGAHDLLLYDPRQGLPRTPLRGIFQGAKVVRGPDWEWGSQDGGEGKPGRVVDIRGWDVETGRSVASVTWADGSTNVYRVGHKGKVDLKCVGEAAGGFYYKGHLPRLGQPAELQRRVSTDGQPCPRGDKAKGPLDTDAPREAQGGHSGRPPRVLEDAHADTPLHCAISAGAGASRIVEVLTEVPGVDVTATNRQGFTLLHHASLKGHALAVRRILARARQLVDAKKEDGFTALHLAVLNNHQEVAQILIQEGRCDVNAQNRKLQTPLHLATLQAHVGLVPLLVDAGCSVNAEDEEGDTALHVALQHHQRLPLVAEGAGGDPGSAQLLSRLQASGLPGAAELTVGAALACFLALEGADVGYTSHRGRSPLDLVAEGRALKALQGCAQRFR